MNGRRRRRRRRRQLPTRPKRDKWKYNKNTHIATSTTSVILVSLSCPAMERGGGIAFVRKVCSKAQQEGREREEETDGSTDGKTIWHCWLGLQLLYTQSSTCPAWSFCSFFVSPPTRTPPTQPHVRQHRTGKASAYISMIYHPCVLMTRVRPSVCQSHIVYFPFPQHDRV